MTAALFQALKYARSASHVILPLLSPGTHDTTQLNLLAPHSSSHEHQGQAWSPELCPLPWDVPLPLIWLGSPRNTCKELASRPLGTGLVDGGGPGEGTNAFLSPFSPLPLVKFQSQDRCWGGVRRGGHRVWPCPPPPTLASRLSQPVLPSLPPRPVRWPSGHQRQRGRQ